MIHCCPALVIGTVAKPRSTPGAAATIGADGALAERCRLGGYIVVPGWQEAIWVKTSVTMCDHQPSNGSQSECMAMPMAVRHPPKHEHHYIHVDFLGATDAHPGAVANPGGGVDDDAGAEVEPFAHPCLGAIACDHFDGL